MKNQHLNKLYFSISLQKLNNLFDKRTYLLHKTSKVLSIKIHTPYSFSEIGKRENNEDALFPQQGQADTHSRLFIVCDGMGGAEGGEIASQMTCDMISQYFEDYVKPDEDIETIEQHIHKALDLVFQNMEMLITDNFHLRKMGTTLALLYLHKAGVTVAHIGDSRIYHIQNTGFWHTEDHSYVYEMYKRGEITKSGMATHRDKNVITKVIRNEFEPDTPDIKHFSKIYTDDYFLLMSDGVLESINEHALISLILDKSQSDSDKTKTLKNLCQQYSRDNYSFIMVRVREGNAVLTFENL